MSKTKIITVFGVLIALLPFLGFPRVWESFFQVFVGFSIVLLSVWSVIDRRLTLKAKAHKRQAHKRRTDEFEAVEPTEDVEMETEAEAEHQPDEEPS